MARRRLLSILTASAMLTAAFAGPAAAIELVEETQDSVTELTEEALADVVDEVGAEVPDELADELPDGVTDAAEEPVAAVAGVVEETVAPSPSSSPSPDSSPSRSSEPTARTSSDTAGYDELLVAAGDIGGAPSLAQLTGTGGSAARPQSSFDLPMAAPAAAPAAPAASVDAPQVADAPAAVADAAPSVLAQPAATGVPEEGTSVMVLVALASLVAAGFGTVRGARVGETD